MTSASEEPTDRDKLILSQERATHDAFPQAFFNCLNLCLFNQGFRMRAVTLNETTILNDAHNALKLDQAQKQQEATNPKIGTLNNCNKAALIILGTTSALAVTAAVVAAVFASYIVAGACAATAVTLALSAIVVSRIKVSQALLGLIKRLNEKVAALVSEIQDLRKQKAPVNAPIAEPQDDKLQKKVDELSQELENAKKSLADKSPVENYPKENELPENKEKIEKQKETERQKEIENQKEIEKQEIERQKEIKRQKEDERQKNEIADLKGKINEIRKTHAQKPAEINTPTKPEIDEKPKESAQLAELQEQLIKKQQEFEEREQQRAKELKEEIQNTKNQLDQCQKALKLKDRELKKRLKEKDTELQNTKDDATLKEIDSMKSAAIQARGELAAVLRRALDKVAPGKEVQSVLDLLPQMMERKEDIIKHSSTLTNSIAKRLLDILDKALGTTSPEYLDLNNKFLDLMKKEPYNGEKAQKFIDKLSKKIKYYKKRPEIKALENKEVKSLDKIKFPEVDKIEFPLEDREIDKREFDNLKKTYPTESEQQILQRSDRMLKDDYKEIEALLNEIIEQEKKFQQSCQDVVTYLPVLKKNKAITVKEYDAMILAWNGVIQESKKLSEKFDIKEDAEPSFDNKLKIYLKAFLPKNIKSYLKAYSRVMPVQIKFQQIAIKKVVVEQLSPKFELNNTILPNRRLSTLGDYQRILKDNISKLGRKMQQRNVSPPHEDFLGALNHNHSYFSAYQTMIDALQ